MTMKSCKLWGIFLVCSILLGTGILSTPVAHASEWKQSYTTNNNKGEWSFAYVHRNDSGVTTYNLLHNGDVVDQIRVDGAMRSGDQVRIRFLGDKTDVSGLYTEDEYLLKLVLSGTTTTLDTHYNMDHAIITVVEAYIDHYY